MFIHEQGVPEHEEIDDQDPVCTHFLALPSSSASEEEAYGTARLWISPEGEAKAQRVAVAANARGQGVGRALMEALEEHVRARGLREVKLGAQLSAVPFYEQLGYTAYGEVFDDAGIPHRMMKRAVR